MCRLIIPFRRLVKRRKDLEDFKDFLLAPVLPERISFGNLPRDRVCLTWVRKIRVDGGRDKLLLNVHLPGASGWLVQGFGDDGDELIGCIWLKGIESIEDL